MLNKECFLFLYQFIIPTVLTNYNVKSWHETTSHTYYVSLLMKDQFLSCVLYCMLIKSKRVLTDTRVYKMETVFIL